MPSPALGNAIMIGLAPEYAPGIPNVGATLDFYRAVLPANIGFNFGSNQSGEINQSGYAEDGVPNAISAAFEWGCRMSTGTLLRVVMALLRDVTKTEEETGVFKYVCAPDRLIAEQTFSSIFALPPVDQMRVDGLMFEGINFQVGNNNPINARLRSRALAFSRLGAAVADGDNTGTYERSPFTTGPLANRSLPFLHFEVTSVSPFRFKCKQAATSTAPTMAGATYNEQKYDPDTLLAVKSMLLSDTGVDLGITGENWDPLMGAFPGTAAEHASELEVGDKFYMPLVWPLPTVSSYLGGQRFTSAHQGNQARRVGDSTWNDIRTLTAQVGLLQALSDDSGSGSRYPNAIDRTGLLMPTAQLASRHKNLFFQRAYEEHFPIELRTYFQGRQLASGPLRESILIDWERCEVKNVTRPPANDQAIVETVQLQGNTNDAGDPPITVTVITDIDMDVPA